MINEGRGLKAKNRGNIKHIIWILIRDILIHCITIILHSSFSTKDITPELPPAFFSTRLTPSPPESRYRSSDLIHSTTLASSYSRLTQNNLSNISEIIDAMDDSRDDADDGKCAASASSLNSSSFFDDSNLIESVFFVN